VRHVVFDRWSLERLGAEYGVSRESASILFFRSLESFADEGSPRSARLRTYEEDAALSRTFVPLFTSPNAAPVASCRMNDLLELCRAMAAEREAIEAELLALTRASLPGARAARWALIAILVGLTAFFFLRQGGGPAAFLSPARTPSTPAP
jgi:hypothetical protein